MKWLQTIRGEAAREGDAPGTAAAAAGSEVADNLACTHRPEAGEPMPETPPLSSSAPLVPESALAERLTPISADGARSAEGGDAPSAEGRGTAGPSDSLDDLVVIKSAIDRAFRRFEQLALGGDEIRHLLRAQFERPQATAVTDAAPSRTEDAVRPLEEIAARQQELNRLFESRIRSDEVQAKTLERLHDELRQYKANFIRQEMLPLFKDVIFCHDFVVREIERQRSAPSTAGDAAAQGVKALEILSQMLLDLLFKYDIEPYRCEGDQFDAKRQQCARTVPTEAPDRDKFIAELGLSGFESPEGIIRREQVTVYKFKQS